MALLRTSKMKKQGSTWGRLCDSLFNIERCRGNERKNRRLLIDQLEERTLLSVSTPDLESNLVNIAITESQGTVTASSLAMDKDGDFVVVWSRVDELTDENGDPIIDPATGEQMTDENIYARYFTKEIQQIDLSGIDLSSIPAGKYGKFSIRYGGNEVQRLSIGASTPNTNSTVDIISGIFQLQYVDEGGTVHTTDSISFSEADFNSGDDTTDPAMLIQSKLRALGGDLADVVVTGVDSQHFTISFGDASNGKNVSQLTVVSADWDTGFLPGAIVETASEPFTVENITLFPNNPKMTITAIEDAFEQYYEYYFVATNRGVGTVRAAIPTVEVTAVKTLNDPGGLYTFNIEFTGDAAYMNVPEIVIEAGAVVYDDGSGDPPLKLNTDEIRGVTLKESGTEFRVNPEEIDNPATQLPDKYAQINPSVAMNAEGDFVIAWESEVPESQNNGSETDIFARMYTPVGLVDPAGEWADGIMTVDMDLDGSAETPIQGVRLVEAFNPYSTLLEADDPLRVVDDVYTFRVNENTANAQGSPSVGMDAVGDFTIAWADSGQPVSFFNGINMRQYSYDGTPKTAVEQAVNAEDTEVHGNPYVAMSDSGYALILWQSQVGMIVYSYTAMYDPEGYVYQPQTELVPARNGSELAACFDTADNYAINWTMGSYVVFTEFNIGGAQIRDVTPANSGNWVGAHYGGHIAMDADGDMTVSFSGYGPDTDNNFSTSARANEFLQEILARDENADLIAAWPDLATLALPFDGMHSGDIDGVIDEVLFNAEKLHQPFTDEMLGRLRTILETIADLARGEANGVMYSQFDADPLLGSPNRLADDIIVNSQRDGNNTRSMLVLDNRTMEGSFYLIAQNLLTGTQDAVEIEPAYVPFGDSEIIDPVETLRIIQAILDDPDESLFGTGMLADKCVVRLLTTAEIDLRQGTEWELAYDPATQYVYEITFIGNMHDSPIVMVAQNIDMVNQAEMPAPPIAETFCMGNPGTTQANASIGMTPEGDYAIAYTEYNLDATGALVASNIYYRYYDESTDTAGPTVTSVETPEGVDMAESPIVYQTDSLSYIVVTMSEQMYDNLTSTGDAVTNPENYRLTIAGEVVEGAIADVYYGLSEAANLATKAALDPTNYGDFSVLSSLPSISYEIVIVVDANGGLPGTVPLGTGSYTLELLTPSSATLNDPTGTSGLRDAAGNRLGRTGFVPNGSDYAVEFTLVVESDLSNKEGLEVRVNETTVGIQTTTASSNEEYTGSTRCVATDSDGDFVVVWISENQDGDGAGVYMRLFDSNGNPMTGETLVNTTTVGDQLECAVAMDADGDFVVVWAGEGQDLDESWGIYGQRFDSMGRTIGGEFQINSTTPNDQVAPTIDMDSQGNFVVVWASQGQSYSYFNDVRAQVYGPDGQRIGSEIRVNSANIPGTGVNPSSNELHPSVAMSEVGSFVVSWTAAESQKNGITTDTVVMARVFGLNGNPLTIPEYEGHEEGNVEFKVNVGDDEFIADYEHIADSRLEAGAFKARNAQVTMNPFGEFIVVWEAFQDNDWIDSPQDRVNSYGIYYRQYNMDGTAKLEVDTNANQVVTALHPPPQAYSMGQSALYYGDQISPTIGVDADGDFFVAWSGNGSSTYTPLAPQNLAGAYDHDVDGVFMRKFRATASGDNENPAVSTQFRVNTTYIGDQASPTIAVTPAGDTILVWSGKGGGDSQGVYFTYYTSDTDTAGPLVTDFLLPDGTPVASSGQVTQQLASIIVTFDEDMYNNPTHTGDAVTNPANYALLIDGVEIVGGISQVFYGLDVAYYMSPEYGLNAQRTNKYQAVLVVDANGLAEGVAALTNGQYQVVVKDNLRDAAGNPLYSSGLVPNGGATSSIIYVNVPTGQETLVSDGVFQYPADGEGQYTYATTADSVAADADGDFVVAWTDTTPGQEGVWVQMYQQTSVLEIDGSRTTTTDKLGDAILVSDQLNASDISVARDADGDFVVTWSAWNAETSWDVYAQRFDAAGTALGNMFRVNSYTTSVQRYSAVATDVDGDFVITWQSLGQDGSGYGVYAKRFSNTGEVVNGSDETQEISFTGGFTGTFKIRWDHDDNTATPDKVTGSISYGGNAFAMAANVENALKAIGANVEVIATSVDVLTIRFVDDSGKGDVKSLWVSNADIVKTGGDSSAEIAVKTIGNGQSGEFIVNDTTEGNQMYPDIAMDADSDFVITWTGTGQDGDPATDSNIYARQFVGNYAFWTADGSTDGTTVNNNEQDKVSTTDDPADHIVPADAGVSGVVQIETYDSFGSGVLLAGSNFILTAAHVVWWDALNSPMPAELVEVHFDLPGGRVTVQATQVIVNPGYTGDVGDGNDLALIKLSSVPEGVTGYELYDGNPIGQIYTLVGYGRIGTGATGATDDNLNNLKLVGQNRFEANGSLADYPDSLLISDFDSGEAENDALGIVYGLNDLGLGDNEALSASGDSGGPLFVDGKIAAIVSFGFVEPGAWDVTAGVDSSFGEFDADTNVQPFADWINNVTQYDTSEFLVNADDILGYDNEGNVTAYYENQSGVQSHSSVAMDDDGDYVIVWTSYGHDGVGNGYGAGVDGLNGVYARRYESDSTVASDVFQVNQTGENDQQNARVSMDADGDFIVAWESFQDGSPADSFGIYARYYARTSEVQYDIGLYENAPLAFVGTNPLLGMNGEMGGEFEVNTTKNGGQRFPGVTMDDTGDAVIVWSGNGEVAGQEDPQGIFFQRFAAKDDVAGPIVADLMNVDSSSGTASFEQVTEGTDIGSEVSMFVVSLSENVSTASGASGADSILNPANWQLTKGGMVLSGAIADVQYGLNMAYNLGLAAAPSNKYEAIVTFDGDPAAAGIQTLGQGTYVLTIKESVKDIFGNKFDGNYDGTPSLDYSLPFTVLGGASSGDPDDPGPVSPPGNPPGDVDPLVNTTTDGDQISPAVATDAEGNYVVVWVSYDEEEIIDPDADPDDDPVIVIDANIKAQLFDKYGQPIGLEFNVNKFTDGEQIDPDVAMDDYGNFVVVWSGQGDEGDSSGVYGHAYDKFGRSIGDDFLVNQTVYSYQNEPSVAMDADGDFVVTWTSYAQDGDLDGVYARRFNVQGTAKGDEMRVNTTTAYRQDNSDVAMDANGNFVVVWESDQQDGSYSGIYGQRYSAAGVKLGSEFRVNATTYEKQIDPAVGMDADGDFVVTWASMNQDGSGYGIFARAYTPAGVAKAASEFLVNQTTINWQTTPDVAMAADGSYTIAWAAFGQDNLLVEVPTLDNGIYARMYNANGTDFQWGGSALGEFRLNAAVAGNQQDPAIAMSDNGRLAAAWLGPDQDEAMLDNTDIYSRVVSTTTSSSTSSLPSITGFVVAETSAQRDGTLKSDESLVISWNVADLDGVASTKLAVDGKPISTVYGPYAAASGFNFASILGTLTSGIHSYTITATDGEGNVSQLTSTFNVVAAAGNQGPMISDVATSQVHKLLSWHAEDADGIASASITIDGSDAGQVNGPYADANSTNGAYFSAWLTNYAAGDHDYTITVVDKTGNSSQLTGSLTIESQGQANEKPVISDVATSQVHKLLSWHAEDADGIASASITIDGSDAGQVNGPYADANSTNGAYFSAWLTNYAAGDHNYTITVVDKTGNSSQLTGSLTIESQGQANEKPVISDVATSQVHKLLSWHAEDADGIASASITIDGSDAGQVNGPYADANSTNGAYFSAWLTNYAAGDHDYTITVVDKTGNSSQLTGSLTIESQGQANENPVISDVATSQVHKLLSWHAEDADGIASASITIDGSDAGQVNGPYADPNSTNGAYFSAWLTNYAAGAHDYTITVVDKAGNSSQLTGSFTLAGSPGGVVARNAVFSGVGRSLSKSVKLDWLYDADDLDDGSDSAGNAVDAVMATY